MMDRPDIETELSDLADMANIADMILELFRGEMTAVAKREISAKQAEEHLDYWIGAASFAVIHTKAMAEQLKRKYLA